jgi:hypothetical protein
MAREPPHLPPEPVCVVKAQRCGLRGALLAHLDRPKGSFHRQKSALSRLGGPSGATGQYITRTVSIAFSHSVDGVSSPVRDHGGLARVPLRTDPSVLTLVGVFRREGGQMQWTRSRDWLCSQTPAGLVCESGPRIRP